MMRFLKALLWGFGVTLLWAAVVVIPAIIYGFIKQKRMGVGTKRSDLVFGKMLYMGRYWEAKANFPPTGQDIEISVDGSLDASLDTQKTFFRAIQDQWPKVSAAMFDHMKAQFGSLPQRMKLSSISVPDSATFDESEWEASFTDEDSGNLYEVTMQGVQPRSSSRDLC